MTDINSAHIGTSALIEKTQVKLAKEINSSTSFDNIKSNSEDLKAVANQFEAIFLEMLLKQARESKLSYSIYIAHDRDPRGVICSIIASAIPISTSSLELLANSASNI